MTGSRIVGKLAVVLALAAGGIVGTVAMQRAGCVGAVCVSGSARITEFYADATLRDDGTVMVNERFVMDFSRPTRDVRRDIPTVYRDEDGWHRIPTVVRTAKVANNVVVPNRAQVSGKSVRVWIGDGTKEYVGEHEFGLTYIMNGGVRSGGSGPYFSWDVIGPDQRMEVGKTVAVIKGDFSGEAARHLIASCNGGDPACSLTRDDGQLTFTSEGPILAVATLPQSTATLLTVPRANALGVHGPMLPFLMPILTFLFCAFRWLRQDPAKRLPRTYLLLLVPLVAAPLWYLRASAVMPVFEAVGSGPNAIAAGVITVFIASLFGLLSFVTSGRATSQPPSA